MDKLKSEESVKLIDRAVTWLDRVATRGDLGLLGTSPVSAGLMIMISRGVQGYIGEIFTIIFGILAAAPMAFLTVKFMVRSYKEMSMSGGDYNKSPKA